MRPAERRRLIRIAAVVLIVFGFGAAAVVVASQTRQPAPTTSPKASTSSTIAGASRGPLALPSGQLAVAVTYSNTGTIAPAQCDLVDILPVDQSGAVSRQFSNVPVLRAPSPKVLIVAVSRSQAAGLLEAAAGGAVSVIVGSQAAPGSCSSSTAASQPTPTPAPSLTPAPGSRELSLPLQLRDPLAPWLTAGTHVAVMRVNAGETTQFIADDVEIFGVSVTNGGQAGALVVEVPAGAEEAALVSAIADPAGLRYAIVGQAQSAASPAKTLAPASIPPSSASPAPSASPT